jgi:hypothetical protein
MRRELLETLREGPDAARDQESGARGVDRPMGGTPHRRRRCWAALPGCCLATIALYALVLVVRPEGTPFGLAQLVALLVIASTSPVLLIAGNGPKEAELDSLDAKAAPDIVTMWSIANTPHTRGLWAHPTGYRQRMLVLFDAALG